MKKIVAVCLSVIFLVTLTGCGAKSDATEAFETMMTAFMSGEREQIRPYYDFETATEQMIAENKDELIEEMLKTLQKMEYKVLSSKKTDSTHVELRLEVTTLDSAEIINRFVEKMMVLVSNEDYQARVGSMSQEEYQGLLAEQMLSVLSQEDIPTVQETLEIGMEKQSGVWNISQGKNEFLNTIFVNLVQAVTSLV